MTGTLRIAHLPAGAPPWAAATLDQLGRAISGRGRAYVCPYAPRLMQEGNLWATAFEPASGSWIDLSELAAAALADGSSIAVALGPAPLGRTLGDHRGSFWEFVESIIRHDAAPWPSTAPVDPADPSWSLNLAGQPVFMLATSPFYQRRASRCLTNTLTVVIQPLAIFTAMLPDRAEATQAKEYIRGSVRRRDGLEPHAFLGAADGSSTHKVRQYFLPDDECADFDDGDLVGVRDAISSRLRARVQ